MRPQLPCGRHCGRYWRLGFQGECGLRQLQPSSRGFALPRCRAGCPLPSRVSGASASVLSAGWARRHSTAALSPVTASSASATSPEVEAASSAEVLRAAEASGVPFRRANRLYYLLGIRDTSSLAQLYKLSDHYRQLLASLPVRASPSFPSAGILAERLAVWAATWEVSELDYGCLIFHHCRLGDYSRATTLFKEMRTRLWPIPPSHRFRSLLLHYSASYTDDVFETRYRLYRLVKWVQQYGYGQEEENDGFQTPLPSTASLPLSPAQLAAVVCPYDEPLYSSVVFNPIGDSTSRQQLRYWRWPPALRAEQARVTLRCYQFALGEGLLNDPDTLHVYLRVMRLLVEARQYAQCRAVYGDMLERGIRETAEGYRLLMTSLVREIDEPAGEEGRGEERKEEGEVRGAEVEVDEVVWRKRQLVKLKLMTLHAQMGRSRVPLTSDHFALLIHGCCRVRDARHALRYYRQLQEMRIQPTLSIFYSLLSLPALSPELQRSIVDELKGSWGVNLRAFRLLLEDGVRRGDQQAVIDFIRQWDAGEWRTEDGMKGVLQVVGWSPAKNGREKRAQGVQRKLLSLVRPSAEELGQWPQLQDLADALQLES